MIRKMPAPRTAKEVKQILGLIGYYRKFVPCFADISRPLTKLTHHNVTFEWMDQCAKAFNHLRKLLMEYPILRVPKSYTRIYPVYRHKRNWVVGSAHTRTFVQKRQNKESPHLLHKWTVQRKPAQLGSPDKRGIYDLYVSLAVKLLRNRCGSDHQK